MDLQLSDKVILVAGASKGLGYGTALAVASEGARVWIGSRSEKEIDAAADQISKETGAHVHGYAFDATSEGSINEWIDKALDTFGTVDGLFVNAGGPPSGRFDDFDDSSWQKAFELTLLSAIRMIRRVLPCMKAKKRGSILVSTSSSIKEPIDTLLLSNVFRSGVAGLAKSLSFELARDSIRVNNIVPGRIDTDRVKSLDTLAADRNGITYSEQRSRMELSIPLGRYGTIQEFGKAAAFLLSDAASYITGEMLVIDGGMMRTVW